jgi:hypothetical protein
MIVQMWMEAFKFIHICIDSSQTVLEHHRSFYIEIFVFISFTAANLLVKISSVQYNLMYMYRGNSVK